jgi:hypothetical protein
MFFFEYLREFETEFEKFEGKSPWSLHMWMIREKACATVPFMNSQLCTLHKPETTDKRVIGQYTPHCNPGIVASW